MSFQRVYKKKTTSKPPKIDATQEPVLQRVPESSADRFSSAAIKNQNFFVDEEELNSLNTKQNSTNTKTLVQQEQTIASQLLPDHHQSPATELLTENGKDDGPLSSDVRLKEDEDHTNENRLSPENKRLSKLDLLRRQDSIPVVVRDFNQIESHLDDERNNTSKNDDENWNLNTPEKINGFMMTSNTNFVHSKFAPDHLKKNNSQVAFSVKSPKQIMSKDPYIHSLSNRGDIKSIE